MRNIVLTVSYDGTNYCGWQRQKNGPTIQEKLEQAASQVMKEPIAVEGCGRTDAGVHAMEYICNFKTGCSIPEDRIALAINCCLPDDIVVKKAWQTDWDFHSRFSAKKKTYLYRIDQGPVPNPFQKNYAWYMKYPLDIQKMNRAAADIVGTHDFRCFMASGGTVKTTVRTVDRLCIEKKGSLVEIEVSANGFLYNMVRIITGTLVYVGVGKLQPDCIPDLIASADRRKAGITAPPQGLYLKELVYEGYLGF